jgi:Myb-like DNA-binding domain
MEPRVFNLLQQDNTTVERHGNELFPPQLVPHDQNTNAAPLPGIRSFPSDINEDFIDPRLFETNKIADIDRRYQNAPLGQPPTSNVDGSALDVQANRGANAAERSTAPATHSKRGIKSALPLAEVLNSNSPQPRNEEVSRASYNEEPRKKRRLDANDTRILPAPPSTAKRGNKRQQYKPTLPPLLAPLHEPPSEAVPKLVPSINTNDFTNHTLDFPSIQSHPGPGPVESEVLPALLSERKEPQRPELKPRNLDPHVNRKGKKKKKWTDEETRHLLQGVAKFGIGSWKKILQHPEYKFNERSAVDLKDR